MQLDRFEAEALMMVRNGREFAPYKKLLERRLAAATGDCTKQSGEQLLRAQGRAQELLGQLNLIEEAPAILEKLIEQEKQKKR